MGIGIFFLTIHNFDRINRFKVNNNKLLNSEAAIKHFLIIPLTLKMLIQIHNKYTINLIKQIFKINFDLFNSFRLDNHYNLYHY